MVRRVNKISECSLMYLMAVHSETSAALIMFLPKISLFWFPSVVLYSTDFMCGWSKDWLIVSVPVVCAEHHIPVRLTAVPPPQQCGLCGMLFLSLLTLLFASCRTGSAIYLQNWIDTGDGLEVGQGPGVCCVLDWWCQPIEGRLYAVIAYEDQPGHGTSRVEGTHHDWNGPFFG